MDSGQPLYPTLPNVAQEYFMYPILSSILSSSRLALSAPSLSTVDFASKKYRDGEYRVLSVRLHFTRVIATSH